MHIRTPLSINIATPTEFTMMKALEMTHLLIQVHATNLSIGEGNAGKKT